MQDRNATAGTTVDPWTAFLESPDPREETPGQRASRPEEADENDGAEYEDNAYSSAIENILIALEKRALRASETGAVSAAGPLTAQELSRLSDLCSAQAQNDRDRAISDTDLGFADVDPDLTGQLVETLQKQLTLASSVDVVREACATIRGILRGGGRRRGYGDRGDGESTGDYESTEEWLAGRGNDLLQRLRLGLEAATILLFVINSPGIDRVVINEDAIGATIVLFRHHLARNILPSINQVGHITAADADHHAVPGSPSLVRTPSASAKKRRRSSAAGGSEAVLLRELKKVYKPVCKTIGLSVLLLERLEILVQKTGLDDQHLLSISTGALISLEMDPSQSSQNKQAHQFHAASIGVVTAIFRQYPRHRQSIVENLFPVMLKLPSYKKSMRPYPIKSSSVLFPTGLRALSTALASLPDAGSIQTISALVVSLVQCAVARPRVHDAHGESDPDSSSAADNATPQHFACLRDCQAICDFFVGQLLQRCSKKGEDGGASEFRPILSNLIDDLLLVLLLPEYPAAEMILLTIANHISKDLLSMCNATTKATAENTYLGTILDAFGKICAAEARILRFHREKPVRLARDANGPPEGGRLDCYCQRQDKDEGVVVCDECQTMYYSNCVGLSRETLPEGWLCDACQLQRIVAFERDLNANLGELGCSPDLVDESHCMRRLLVDYLSILARKSGVVGFRDAYEFHLARWLTELRTTHNGSSDAAQQGGIHPLVSRLIELWDPRESSDMRKNAHGTPSLNGMLHCLSDEGRSRMVVHVAATQSRLLLSHRSQIGLFVNKLMENKNLALLRRLALKALEKVTDADPMLMIYPFVRKAVTQRFTDEAISVREAAVSLVGLYVVHSPAVANAFHKAFMVGLNDPGVSVRKRTIKILQDILCTNPGYKGRARACSEMLRLAADPKEDDGVRDAIHDLFLKVWFENGDEKIANDAASPGSPLSPEFDAKSPGSQVVELVNPTTGATPITPTPQSSDAFASPPPTVRETRSTERRIRKKRLQMRSEIAAEQMVEVVKAAETGEYLTVLFTEILGDFGDAGQGRKAASRRKRKVLAEGHCAMLVDAVFEILLRVEESRSGTRGATPKDVVAVMRTIYVFTDISPSDVHRHLDTLLPYFKADNGLPLQEEAIVVSSLCDSVSRMSGVLGGSDLEMLSSTSIADDLVKITYNFGKDALSSAVRALCALANHSASSESSIFRAKLLGLAETFYKYLLKHRDESDFLNMKMKAKANVQRALSVLGSVCRHHETSTKNESLDSDDDEQDGSMPRELTYTNLTWVFEELFLVFLLKNESQTKCAALRGLCGVFIARPREILRLDQTGLISDVMAPDAPLNVQLESLICWQDILLTEEARIESGEAKAKMDSKTNITVSKKISGDQDADATLFGGVLTSHAGRLFEMTQVQNKSVRFAALDLIGHLLRQGQINPNEAVPYLLALQGDVDEEGIRSLALKLLMVEGEKRPDMLRQRVYAGIKQAYMFQKQVYPDKDEISALVSIRKGTTTHTECVFGRVFRDCIANIRKQRRGLFESLLQRFDLHSRRKSEEARGRKASEDSEADDCIRHLPLLSFTAQVLAYLPYKVASDPLFIIYSITAALSLRGPDLLDRFADFLRPLGLSSSDEMDETNLRQDDLEIAARHSMPRHTVEAAPLLVPKVDISTFSVLCAEAGAQILLLRLKAFLSKSYDLSESRIFGFNPDAKEEREKAISKASQLDFNSTVAVSATATNTDEFDGMIKQYAEFRALMRNESHTHGSDIMEDDDDFQKDNRKRRRSDAMDSDAND